MKTTWTRRATRRRGEILITIAEENPAAAMRVGELFQAVAERLSQFPNVGRLGRIPGTRELLAHESYLFVHAIRDDQVVIPTIVHTARRWPPADVDR